MENKKLILVGTDGRPSMLSLFPSLSSDTKLLVKVTPTVSKKHPERVRPEYYREYTNNVLETFERKPLETQIRNNIVIRWGTRMGTNGGSNIVYNEPAAIGRASNKRDARSMLMNSGIRVPRNVNPQSVRDEEYPVIARPKFHSKGRNFVVLKDYGAFKYHFDTYAHEWYYSAFIDKTQEFRVHCAHGKILAILEKPKPKKEGVIAWNRTDEDDEGFVQVPWSEWQFDVCTQALGAIATLGLDFGGVDIIVKDGQAYVLEVNTAPALDASPYTAGRYVSYFNWLYAKETKREHFDYTRFKQVKSLAWKDFNFEDRKPNKLGE